MDIGVIGSGNIGSTLAKQLKALGHQVSIANSRGPATLTTVAAETGATAVTVEQAALAKDLVIISIPQVAVPRLPLSILRSSPAVIVDTGNYYPTRDGAIQEIDNGLADSQWVASVLGMPVIKAFNNILANSLATRGTAAGNSGRICLSVAGDDVEAKKVVQDLIRDLGFDAIDAGSLADSWRQQPGTPAYCKTSTPERSKLPWHKLLQGRSKAIARWLMIRQRRTWCGFRKVWRPDSGKSGGLTVARRAATARG